MMMKVLGRLWADDAGVILSAELVLIATLLVIGMIVGLTSVRDSVVQELGDLAQAFAVIDQDFSFTRVSGHTSSTAGAVNDDREDNCENAAMVPGARYCVSVTSAPQFVNSEGAFP